MIDVKNLSKSFGDNLVLNDISEHIYPGDKVVIIGPSGSGKSTFLRCLNLMEYPTSGSIHFNGVETTDPKVDIDGVRRQMGMVFQHFNLFPNMTIKKNITLAPVRTKLMTQAEAYEKMSDGAVTKDAILEAFQNNTEVRQKVVSGEWDFTDVGRALSGGQQRAPRVSRSATNGKIGTSTFMGMSDEDFASFDERIRQGAVFDARR